MCLTRPTTPSCNQRQRGRERDAHRLRRHVAVTTRKETLSLRVYYTEILLKILSTVGRDI